MDRPHLSWPISFAPGGGYAMVEQDSDDDIASCIATIVSWPLGTRRLEPDFGVPDESFLQGGADLEELRAAILASEPRAGQLELLEDARQLEDFVANVRVGFTGTEGERP